MARNFRSKWMDPDFRRDSKTDRFCVICQRDLAEGHAAREVRFELDRFEAIHPEDWDIAALQIAEHRAAHLDAFQKGLVGMDCARKLGLEWSKEEAK